MKDTFCSYCGTAFEDTSTYPRKCKSCENEAYNSLPAAAMGIVCLESNDDNKLLESVLISKRAIEPIGKWCFPGGYLEKGESWQKGLSREFFEETGIVIPEDKWCFSGLSQSTGNNHLLIFAAYSVPENEKENFIRQIKSFTPNHEVSEIKLAKKYRKLAFPTQDAIMKYIFSQEKS